MACEKFNLLGYLLEESLTNNKYKELPGGMKKSDEINHYFINSVPNMC